MGAGAALTPDGLAVVDALANAVVVVDQTGIVRHANRVAERLFGWPAAELVGVPVERLVPDDLQARHIGRRRAFLRHPTSRPMGRGRELACRRRDGSIVPVEISLGVIGDGDGKLVMATIVDISERTSLQQSHAAATEALRQRAGLLERRAAELSQLAELGELLESCETEDEAFASIERVAGQLFAADAGAVYALTASGTTAEAVASWGSPRPAEAVFAPMDCLALRRGRVIAAGSDDGQRCPHITEPLVVGSLCVPLVAQAEAIGTMHLQVREESSTGDEADALADRRLLLDAMARHVSLALANIRLRASLREQSSRDALTGLFNRRYLEETLERELRRAAREARPMGVIMADIDHFKALNDAFGHLAGDDTLRRVGAYLAGAFRAGDIVCRYGGEEFVVLLPGASLADCHRSAENLRSALTAAGPGDAAPPPVYPSITVSVGVAAYPDHGETAAELILAADTAMYRAKTMGRDRVVVAGPREFTPTG